MRGQEGSRWGQLPGVASAARSGPSTHICLLSRSDLFIRALMLSVLSAVFPARHPSQCSVLASQGWGLCLSSSLCIHSVEFSLSLSLFFSQLLIQQLFTYSPYCANCSVGRAGRKQGGSCFEESGVTDGQSSQHSLFSASLFQESATQAGSAGYDPRVTEQKKLLHSETWG